MDFDYKKYSLENLEKWIEDAINSAEASPQEIYDTIKNVVTDNYHCYKNNTERCYELLALLNGNGKGHLSCDKDDKSPECQKAWNDFWEENYYPEESSQYDEETLDAMCEKAKLDDEKRREYNLREVEYYNKRAELDIKETSETVTSGASVSPKKDKVVKWQLPVEIDGISGEYYVQFPDDLMEAADIKENDLVEWIDLKNGSFELRKVKNVK